MKPPQQQRTSRETGFDTFSRKIIHSELEERKCLFTLSLGLDKLDCKSRMVQCLRAEKRAMAMILACER